MKRSCAALALAGSLFLAVAASAASLSLSPVGLDLSGAQKASSISLTNKAATPISLQVRIFKWSQVDGKDVLEPTRLVLASPPAATIQAGATYTIRVVRTGPVPTVAESYRLVIDELPSPAEPGDRPKGLSMVLRTSLPVFFTPEKAQAHINWTLWQDGQGVHLRGSNQGGRHVKLIDLALETSAGRVSFGSQLAGYILPGASRQFDLPREESTKQAAASAIVDGASVIVTAKAGKQTLKDPVRVAIP